jgi:hypothetical protein
MDRPHNWDELTDDEKISVLFRGIAMTAANAAEKGSRRGLAVKQIEAAAQMIREIVTKNIAFGG